MHHSEWGYHRDEESGNCIQDPKCGPELDCLTGYVCYVFNVVQYKCSICVKSIPFQ